MNRVRTGVASGYLILCVLLGGASASGALANGLLQLLALVLLLMHVWSRGAPPVPTAARWLILLFLAFALVIGVQLIPLPPSIWTTLPGRDVVATSLGLLGVPLGDMPASLDPRRTLGSLLSLLPPAAMFLVTIRLTRDERSVVAKVLLGLAVMTILLGAFQLLGGTGSRLRFYDVTNADSSVGFFANANHVATLLLCSLPFAAMLMARAAKGRGSGREGKSVIYGALLLFIIVGIAMNGSVAGYGLLFPTAIASFFLYRRSAGAKMARPGWWAGGLAVLLVVSLGVGNALVGERLRGEFDGGDTTGRQISIPTTLAAAKDFSPVGSGLGTFRDLYRTYEPLEDVTFIYVNHAHNDYAELFLEAGLPGLFLVLAFIAWWATRGFAAWRSEYDGVALARAGSVALGVILLHSVVDYPLRTSAIAGVAALAAGFMVQPPVATSRRSRGRQPSGRHMTVETL